MNDDQRVSGFSNAFVGYESKLLKQLPSMILSPAVLPMVGSTFWPSPTKGSTILSMVLSASYYNF